MRRRRRRTSIVGSAGELGRVRAGLGGSVASVVAVGCATEELQSPEARRRARHRRAGAPQASARAFRQQQPADSSRQLPHRR
eukprot:scaffold13969_cov125-Isochrysis_galbana.AAC.3